MTLPNVNHRMSARCTLGLPPPQFAMCSLAATRAQLLPLGLVMYRTRHVFIVRHWSAVHVRISYITGGLLQIRSPDQYAMRTREEACL